MYWLEKWLLRKLLQKFLLNEIKGSPDSDIFRYTWQMISWVEKRMKGDL